MSDGDVDYSKYTLRELEEALAGINGLSYPQNYENLCRAYEQLRLSSSSIKGRHANTETKEDPDDADAAIVAAFWDSRLVGGFIGAICLWWAYELLSDPGACPSGTRLMGMIVEATCERLGLVAAASIPFVIGALSLVLALGPKRRGGP